MRMCHAVKKLYFMVILSLFMVAGCNQNEAGMENQEGGGPNTTLLGNQRTGEDRGRTMSDQNPNLVNFNGTVNNQEAEIEKARETIEMTNEYVSESIWVNGNDMFVTVSKKGDLTQEERKDNEEHLRQMLIQAVPRYHIDVEILGEQTRR